MARPAAHRSLHADHAPQAQKPMEAQVGVVVQLMNWMLSL